MLAFTMPRSLPRHAPTIVASLFSGFWFLVFYSQFFAPGAPSCWFYDPNLGEHSFSEAFTLFCYALAALFSVQSLRRSGERLYAGLLLVIAVCFMEEANYGQVFLTSDSLFFDRVQWAVHTQTSVDEALHLYELLTVLVVVLLPCLLLAGKRHGSSRAAGALYAIPAVFMSALGLLARPWTPSFMWDGAYIQCVAVPEEIFETLLASSLCYLLALHPLVQHRRAQSIGTLRPL